jgi:hypothetical protein
MSADEAPELEPVFTSEADVDAVLFEFQGDARAAIRGLLHDLAMLAEDANATTSHGYVRGRRLRIVCRDE